MRRPHAGHRASRYRPAGGRPYAPPPRPAPEIPQLSQEDRQAAAEPYYLSQARAWGYRPEDPDSLRAAIERLRAADRPDPYARYRDRSDPNELLRRQDARELAERLEAIEQRGTGQPHRTTSTEVSAMNISQAFPSNYLKAGDLNGRAVKVRISGCELEDLDGEHKPVLRFEGKQKGMVLNRTNAGVLAAALGDETDNWTGSEVEIYPDRTMFQGRMVDCLRVRVPVPPAPSRDDSNSDVPW